MPVTSPLVRFGAFELDLRTGELSKNGRRLKVQEQPFRLLRLLLEQRGQTVSRERLKAALWPADTFVDFDHSLNAAVAKLRQVLGDSAENPRFIETMARRGYRFLAPVEFVGNSNGSGVGREAVNGTAQALPAIGKIKWTGALVYGAAAVALVTIVLWFLQKGRPVEAELVKLTEDTGLTTDPAVSPDGKLLAYASDRGSDGNLNIWIQQLGPGDNAVEMTHDSVDAREPAFSPDGTRIAFRSKKGGGGIYTIPVIGGEPARLTQSGRNPRFSPDGRWIAYWSGGGDAIANATGAVYIVPSSGGEPKRLGLDLYGLHGSQNAAADPVWSPDSKHLLVLVPPKYPGYWNDGDWWVLAVAGGPSVRTGDFGVLSRQGFSLGFDRVPQASEWTKDFITFSAAFGDAMNAFRAPISRDGHITGPAERLTSGTTLELSPTLRANSGLIFASLNQDLAVWSLPADPDRVKVTGELKRITKNAAAILPSISSDGRMLAFTALHRRHVASRDSGSEQGAGTDVPLISEQTAELQVEAQDLVTGKEAVLSTADTTQWHPQISRDGSVIAYTSSKPGREYADPLNGGVPKVLVEGRNIYTWDWSRDNRRLLFDKTDAQVHVVDRLSGNEKLFLSKPGSFLFQAKFSPDDKALVVEAVRGDDSRLFIVPLENDIPVPADRWMPIDHRSNWDDKPRWSPSGDLIYFVSDRDSYLCLWAQRVESRTKQPVGIPFPVYHFHKARLAMANLSTGYLEIAVAKDKIVFGLSELTGNIWSLRRK